MNKKIEIRLFTIVALVALLIGLTSQTFASSQAPSVSVKLTTLTKISHTVKMNKYGKVVCQKHNYKRIEVQDELSSKRDSSARIEAEKKLKEKLSKDAQAKKKAYLDKEEAKKWKTGIATAYGDYTDPYSTGYAKAGDAVTNSSMGVAIPYTYGRDYFGKKIEIEHNGIKVTGVINDWVSSDGVALSLQPGIVHELGFSTAAGWGVRSVKYKIIEN